MSGEMSPDPVRYSTAESAAMNTALGAAAQGIRGANPLVGAVLLDPAGQVIATGYHRGAGTAHAEVDALASIRTDLARRIGGSGDLASSRDGELARALAGATMLVTLEPCNHTGRTGPCAQAIIDAGIRQVIYAVDDPHQPAAGGAQRLRDAGVQVRSGLLAQEAVELNRRWFAAVRAERPFTTLHLAQTLDGRIAAADGSSQWITSAASRADSHGIRRLIDAILVGTETVFADNPRLTAREASGEDSARQPLRVVMGLRDIPAGAAVRATGPAEPAGQGGFLQLRTRDPLAASRTLFDRGVRHLMVEGGSRISAAFLSAQLVDELIVYLAPTLLGAGIPALGELGIGTLAEAQRWDWDAGGGAAVKPLGPDLKLRLKPAAMAAGTTGGN
ncbi:bifunctional diaminohydroxyphosphoribosylaminopyrimidine deaminase/5-amino-6-(5-phosphoribosylamino)uracil reductase RibD [Arthrobacter sp. H14-L1]|uniref:bifunctional diaminohydroxyphosphoribosylaminopyrimidine deaminase/5-amino-6-(5-phosphoribosylamino)uracil reductase RibD n=1 Tax=Arthrobacter sp. H14-L1 TaxID=2996697 RepID=UPI0022713E62|nr:bifunctional diaminohydroxyphosphoribosylaminopyrimidine deaminase/5-amino-6-(5-phosphoribosylamino)uracil reductase RibD [Arthrobacter sp. H14-L1]MCY0904346.1 bifunctional diaminohydroxyphosphoribosylaminopyrimidine deaminase/5-amino-6-(5-phosphoribosylamino)uracil reductase RibD [Arthrobacter sp. H14-L1]